MCISLAVIGAATALGSLGLGAMGMVNKQANAEFQAKAAAYQERMRQQQLAREADQVKLEAARVEAAKSDDFLRRRSAALAAIGASGVGEHISFFQGIDPEQQRAVLRDINAVRFNMEGNLLNIADQIEISGFRKDTARYNAESSKVAATMAFAGQVLDTIASVATYASGGAGGKPKGGSTAASSMGVNIGDASLYAAFGY